jgi:probable F420-dependent oxidoreductase
VQLGAPFPMVVEWSADDVRRFARDVEQSGLDFVTVSGHALASAPGRYPEKPARVYVGPYHDPVTLFAHLAGITEHLRLRTSLLILPLHATALVAAAVTELCVLSGDRFELGVGISWNDDEYRAVGQDVHRRGRRLSEQLQVLRLLWASERVTFEGEFHQLADVGVGRLPATQPKIWVGGSMIDRNVARIVAHGDGWIPSGDPTPHIEGLRAHLRAAGRDPASFSINGRLDLTVGDEGAWATEAMRLQSAGVTHIVLDPGAGRTAAEASGMVALAAAAIAR